MTRTTKLLILNILLFAVISSAQSNHQNDLFSLTNRLKFANHLYKEQDFLRAINEYKEVLKSYENDTIRFRFANSFFRIGRFDEAAQNFKTLFVGSRLEEEAKLSYYNSIFFNNDFGLFRTNYENGYYLPQKYSKVIEQLNSASYFIQKTNIPNENILVKPFADTVQTKLIYFYQMIKNPPQKSVATAALLSAVIPGAGKYYTGELSDGLIAFGATVLSGFLAVTNFNNDHQFRGWLFSGLTAFFYGGSIYGSAASAKIYNTKLKSKIDEDILRYFEERNYFLPKIEF